MQVEKVAIRNRLLRAFALLRQSVFINGACSVGVFRLSPNLSSKKNDFFLFSFDFSRVERRGRTFRHHTEDSLFERFEIKSVVVGLVFQPGMIKAPPSTTASTCLTRVPFAPDRTSPPRISANITLRPRVPFLLDLRVLLYSTFFDYSAFNVLLPCKLP